MSKKNTIITQGNPCTRQVKFLGGASDVTRPGSMLEYTTRTVGSVKFTGVKLCSAATKIENLVHVEADVLDGSAGGVDATVSGVADGDIANAKSIRIAVPFAGVRANVRLEASVTGDIGADIAKNTAGQVEGNSTNAIAKLVEEVASSSSLNDLAEVEFA